MANVTVEQGGFDISSSNLNANPASRLRNIRRSLPDGTMEDDVSEGSVVKPTFSIDDKLTSNKFSKDTFVREMQGAEVSISYLQKEGGFLNPILVRDKEGLGVKVPNVGVHEIRAQVGSRRYLDVMDVTTQKNIQLSMKEFNKYWDTPASQRTQLLNVISLELSNTKLDPQVRQMPLYIIVVLCIHIGSSRRFFWMQTDKLERFNLFG